MSRRNWGITALWGAGLAVLALLAGLFWPASETSGKSASAEEPTTATSVEEGSSCDGAWEISRVGDHGNNRWYADGISEIREAETDEEAREAAEVWLDQTKHYANLLAGAAAYFNVDEDVEFDALIDGECASDEAVKLVAQLELALADARITPDQAPANGYNSGVNANGDVVAASHAGITGDREAIRVELKDGTTVWIMARCGNPVVTDKPEIPEGPTDQPPPEEPPPTTSTTSTTTTTLAPKEPEQSTNNNEDIPDQVRKPQPSPDNDDEIQEGPTQPRDTPTGCDGPCPTSTTTTTAPPSQSTSTTTPSCGEAGQPSCSNTGNSPPTTTAPAPEGDPNEDPNEGTVPSP